MVRFALLSAHYRKELDFTDSLLTQCKTQLDHLYKSLLLAHEARVSPDRNRKAPVPVMGALDDDLNTALALSRLHEIAGNLIMETTVHGKPQQARASGDLLAAGDILGILREDPVDWFKWAPSRKPGLSDAEIEALKERRIAARESRDFAEADKIRAVLAADGVILEDRPDGTTRWRRAG